MKRQEMDDLDPLKDFGSVTVSGGGDQFTGSNWSRMNTIEGSLRGCELLGTRMVRLHSPGLWRIEGLATLSSSINPLGQTAQVRLELWPPGGWEQSGNAVVRRKTVYLPGGISGFQGGQISAVWDVPVPDMEVGLYLYSPDGSRGWRAGDELNGLTVHRQTNGEG